MMVHVFHLSMAVLMTQHVTIIQMLIQQMVHALMLQSIMTVMEFV